MLAHNLSNEETLKILNSSINGLSDFEANKRLNKFGKNVLNGEKQESIFKRFISQFSDLMVIILIISALLSIGVALFNKSYGDLFEGGLILFIVLCNAIIGVIQQGKAENALNELKKSTQTFVKVKRNNNIIRVSSEDITIGDIIYLESGDIVPCDLRLISTNELKCNESSLTGESVSVEKNANIIMPPQTITSSQKNMCFSGTFITNGSGFGVVCEIGENTVIGKIAQKITTTQKELTPIQKNLNKINEVISIIILIICAIVFVVEVFFSGQTMLSAFLTAVSLAVAAIPESLPAVITIIMALGVFNLSKKGAIVKKLPIVETLGSCQIICTDKTGTLTQNSMEIKKIYSPFDDTSFSKLLPISKCRWLYSFAVNNTCITSNNEIIGDGTEVALCKFLKDNNFDYQILQNEFPIIKTIPFDSNRKMMTTLIKSNNYISYTKGSIEFLLNRCNKILIDDKIEYLTNNQKERILHIVKNMCLNSLRVLGFAYKEFNEIQSNMELENDMTFLGVCGMFDPPRPEVKNAIENCFNAGLTPIMITGDHRDTAFSIAKELNIAKNINEVITGEELDKFSTNILKEKINKYKVFARVTSEHKEIIVNEYQKQGKIVAMTGDGVNDAPSLKKANIGIGMGKSGSDVAKTASDMIITDDNFSTIVVAIEEGRKIYQNIQKTIQFLLSTNLVEVITIFVTSLLFPNLVFLLPTQLLFINLVTDGLPAFALGVEKAEKDIMKQPPRKNTNNIFSKTDIISSLSQSVYQIIVILSMYIIGLKFFDNSIVSTMCFFTFSLMQIIHSINMKTYYSIFSINLFDNKYFNFSFLICVGLNLLIAFVPFFQTIFSIETLSLNLWLIVLICSISIIPFVEIQKLLIKFIKKKKYNKK